MNPKPEYRNEEYIDLRKVFLVLWENAIIIILSGILLALVATIHTKLFVAPTYESTTKIVILNKPSGDVLAGSDLQMSSLLSKDYAELIRSRTVTESVIAELGLNLTHGGLSSKITVSSSDSRILTITVTDSDPYEASRIANAVRDTAARHIQNAMDAKTVNVVDRANIPAWKSSPDVGRAGMKAGLLGVFLAGGIVVALYLLNDTIRTPEDIERYLGLSNLGIIPLSETEKKSKRRKQKMIGLNTKDGRDKR